jgi:2,4-dienoyl-CoA reductase-like NADH-dependent reductase (Old Yellow Enzyme family)
MFLPAADTLICMVQSVAEVLESAKALRRDEVADLAYKLLRVLDGDGEPADQASVDAAWRAEYRRRVDDIESGRVQLVSHAETVAQARAMLASRRK